MCALDPNRIKKESLRIHRIRCPVVRFCRIRNSSYLFFRVHVLKPCTHNSNNSPCSRLWVNTSAFAVVLRFIEAPWQKQKSILPLYRPWTCKIAQSEKFATANSVLQSGLTLTLDSTAAAPSEFQILHVCEGATHLWIAKLGRLSASHEHLALCISLICHSQRMHGHRYLVHEHTRCVVPNARLSGFWRPHCEHESYGVNAAPHTSLSQSLDNKLCRRIQHSRIANTSVAWRILAHNFAHHGQYWGYSTFLPAEALRYTSRSPLVLALLCPNRFFCLLPRLASPMHA